MAELTFPEINADNLKAPEENLTNTGSTAPKPIEEVKAEEIITNTPIEEVKTEPIIETPKVEEITAPVTPTIETPKVTTPKATNDPIKTTQEVKSEQLAITEQENLIKAENDTKAQAEFQNAVNSWASVEELTKINQANPQLQDNFKSILRSSYKQNANLQYIAKYAWMGNEEMTTAVNNSDIVIGSDKYKLLSPEQRTDFEQYYKEATANNTKEDDIKKFDSDETKIISNSPQEQEIAWFVWLNIRKKSTELFTTKEITDSSKTLKDKKDKINDYNDTIEGIEDDVKKRVSNIKWFCTS